MTTLKPPPGYRLRLALLMPALLVYTAWQAIKGKSTRYLLQRLGLTCPVLQQSLWIHCASVGELNTALPLIAPLQQRHPNTPVLLTTTTATGAAVFQRQTLAGVTHCYLPLDAPSMVERLLMAANPRIAIIMETELWPNLFSAVRSRGIPLLIANARLSSRTLRAGQWLQSAYRHCLTNTTAILARSETDASRYRQLGARQDTIEVIGNLKFAPPLAGVSEARDLIGQPYVLAASTHHDEERQLIDAWIPLALNDTLLVIAPRHPHRGVSIAKHLRAMGIPLACRSRGEPITPDTRVYLADTLGELQHLIAHARWVFIGGSLIPRGGHNLLEPARACKAVLCGPHMENFKDETQAMITAGGAIQLQHTHQLSQEILRLTKDPQTCQTMGNAAASLLQIQETIALRYTQAIEQKMPDHINH